MEQEESEHRSVVLYVEDEPDTREIVARALAGEYPDLALLVAADGVEGLELFRTHRPELVITDIRMPVMDGLRMGEEIRLIDPEVEMIALTAYSDTGFLINAIEIGFSHYVLKPTDFDKLFAAVGRSLHIVGLKRQVRDQHERIRQFSVELERRVEELQESEERLKATFNQAAVGIAHIAPDGRFLRVNQKYCDISGCVRRPWEWLTIEDNIHPDDLPRCREHHQALLAGTLGSYSIEKRFVHPDGQVVWAGFTASMVSDPAGKPAFIVGILDDITARKRVEEERERLLAQHEAVLNSIHEGVVISDPSGNIITMNRSALALHRFDSPEEAMRQVHQFQENFEVSSLEGETVPLDRWPISRALQGERFTDYDLCVRRRDTGHEFVGSYSGTPVVDGTGRTILAVLTMRDITERKQAEEALRRSELKFSTIFHSVPATITISTLADAVCVDINEAGLRMLGYRRDEVIGRSFVDLGVWESRSARERLLRMLEEEGTVRDLEVTLSGKGGRQHTVLFSAERIDFDEGRYLLSIITDITQRKLMEEEIVRLNTDLSARAFELEVANRELEAFDYTVAHDLRKPLTVINGYCQALMEMCRGATLDKECLTFVKEAYEGTLRMNRLIDALLLFSSSARAEPKRERVDLSLTAKEVAGELSLAEPERKVTFRIDDDVVVEGDPSLLRVVMANLMGNAWKYTTEREEAVIEFGSIKTDAGHASFVKDNGIGFDSAQAAEIFTPFRRLPSGQRIGGLGIGLATVKRIIARHGGKVWAEGEPGQGATFYFSLPGQGLRHRGGGDERA